MEIFNMKNFSVGLREKCGFKIKNKCNWYVVYSVRKQTVYSPEARIVNSFLSKITIEGELTVLKNIM